MESFSVARDFFSTIVERVLRWVLINKLTKQRWEDLLHRLKALPEYNRRHTISILRIFCSSFYYHFLWKSKTALNNVGATIGDKHAFRQSVS